MDDIDMKSFSGELQESAAATEPVQQQAPETPSEDFPVHKEFLEPQEVAQAPVESPVTSPQSEHFKALRQEVDRIKQEKDELRANLEMMRANMAQQSSMREPPPAPKPMFDGMRDDDIPNAGDIRKAWEQRENQYKARLEELQVAQDHSDYRDVLEKFTAPLIRNKPHLAEAIHNSSNKALTAYELGRLYQQQSAPQPITQAPPAPHVNAQRIVENSRKPGSLSGAGGTSALSQADYIASMSDKEFMTLVAKNQGGY